MEDQSVLQKSSANVPSILVGLESDPSTTAEDKYERARAIYAKWKHEDIEEPVQGEDLLLRQKCRIKVIWVKSQPPDDFSRLNWGVDTGAISSTSLHATIGMLNPPKIDVRIAFLSNFYTNCILYVLPMKSYLCLGVLEGGQWNEFIYNFFNNIYPAYTVFLM